MSEYAKKNIETIEQWIDEGWEWGKPISMEAFERAKSGDFDLLLTPRHPVPHHWLLPIQGKKVLGLAAGGGQQMPVLAALGAKVTLMDYSARQIETDRLFAEKAGYSIELVQADFTEKFPFEEDSFDVIVCPVSLVYARKLRPIFEECARVLRVGGVMLLGCDNGMNFVTEDEETISLSLPMDPVANAEQRKRLLDLDCGFQFSHGLEETLGGLLRSGFRIEDLYEDVNSEGKLAEKNIPSYYAVKVRLERKD